MQDRMAIITVALLCVMVSVAAYAQTDTCGGPTGVCPPTGTEMGQSDYQRTPHPNVYQPSGPICVTTTPPTPIESTPLATTPYTEPSAQAGAGLGPLTPPVASKIAVDDKFIYVLMGDEVVKIDKNDLHVVGRMKVTQSGAP